MTSFHHQPEAQHPKSSAIHKLPADYPIYRSDSEHAKRVLANLKAEDLRTLFRSARAARGLTGKKVQRYGSQHTGDGVMFLWL